MKYISFCLLIWLALGCQQNQTSSNPATEVATIKQPVKSDSTQTAEAEYKSREELFYENMIGQDFAVSSFTTIDNEKLSSSDLRGKVVFLNFWFKNCPPCLAEMEGLKLLEEKYEGDNCTFIMVTYEELGIIKEIQKAHDLRYKMVSVDKDTISSWGIKGYPSSFVLDKTGKIVYARAGGQVEVQKATAEVLSHVGPEIEAQLELSN
jgi:thiol-disulfide isomerase/thioredoxin